MEFNGSHPVASVAARLCRTEHGHSPSWTDVACPECWEAAVLADKEAAVEAGLPESCPQEPDLIDAVAVERAVAGGRVELTVAEWQAAKRALMQRRQVCLTYARLLLSRNVTVIDALGTPLDAPMLSLASRGVAPSRVVTLAAAHRSRRRAARRAAYTAAAAAALGRNAGSACVRCRVAPGPLMSRAAHRKQDHHAAHVLRLLRPRPPPQRRVRVLPHDHDPGQPDDR